MNEMTNLKMKAILLINEIFVPLGLKPIEDLPQACPKDGRECVLAIILKENFDWEDVFVSDSVAQFKTIRKLTELEDSPWISKQTALSNRITNHTIDIPKELSQFIIEFDLGNMPELIDLESMDTNWQNNDTDGKIIMLHKIKNAGIDVGNRLEERIN